MKDNTVQQKSYAFALSVIALYRELLLKNEFVLSKQLLRAGTSIGANVEEALAGQSRADFLCKMSIASKEAREARYWLSDGSEINSHFSNGGTQFGAILSAQKRTHVRLRFFIRN